MSSDDRPERRHEPRIKAMNLVHVEEYGFPTLTEFKTDEAMGKTMDLSHDGMSLELDHCLPLWSRVQLDLQLGEQTLRLNGFVKSTRALANRRCDMGIEFIDVTPEQYELLHEYLELRSD